MKHSEYDNSQSSPDKENKEIPDKQILFGYDARADFWDQELNRPYRLFDESESKDDFHNYFNSNKR